MMRPGRNTVRSALQVGRTMVHAVVMRGPVLVSRTWRECRGVTSLEFAMVFPIIMVLIVGAMEVDRVLYMQFLLQGATADAARYGFTGNASADAVAGTLCPAPYNGIPQLTAVPINTQYEVTCRVVEDMCPLSMAPTSAPLTNCPFDITQAIVQVYNFLNLQDLGSNTGGTSGTGLANQIVVYNINYSLPFATGVLSGKSGLYNIFGLTIPINGYSLVYNEPFIVAGSP
jgi:Flp pilus assembly protein TadG